MKAFKKIMTTVLAASMVVGMACSVFAKDTASPTGTPVPTTTVTPTKTPTKKPTATPKPTATVVPRSGGTAVAGRTTSTTASTGSGGYVIEPLGTNSKRTDSWTDHVPAADQAAIKAKTVDEFIAALGSSTAAGKDSVISAVNGLQFLAYFFDCYPTGSASKTNATVTMNVPGISKYEAADIAVIHFSETRGVWETLNFAKGKGDQIAVSFKDFSPTAILVRDSNPVTPVTVTSAVAPKTGVASTWAVYAVIAMVLAAAAVLVYRRKRA